MTYNEAETLRPASVCQSQTKEAAILYTWDRFGQTGGLLDPRKPRTTSNSLYDLYILTFRTFLLS